MFKTVEMTVDFRSNPPKLPLITILNNSVSAEETFSFLPGPKVGPQHRLQSQKGPAEDVLPASTEEVQPALGAADPVLHCNSLFSAPPSSFGMDQPPNKTGTERTIRTAERIIGVNLPSIQDLYTSRVRKRADNISADPSHTQSV